MDYHCHGCASGSHKSVSRARVAIVNSSCDVLKSDWCEIKILKPDCAACTDSMS